MSDVSVDDKSNDNSFTKKQLKSLERFSSRSGSDFKYTPVTSVLGEDVDQISDDESSDISVICIDDDEDDINIGSDIKETDSDEIFIPVSVDDEDSKKDLRTEVPDIKGDPRCPWRPNNYIPSTLSEDIKLFTNWMAPRPAEKFARESFIDKVFAIIYRVCGKDCTPLVFGSFATGLYLPTSDIDCVILNSQVSRAIHRLAAELRKQPFIQNIIVITKTRVPLIKFESKDTHIQMDISFDKDNGPRNTRIVSKLLEEFPIAKSLMILIKYILKQKELNEVYTGGIGSYALFLMIISFLQHHETLPEYQTDPAPLLIDFCELYGCEFNYYTTGISVRKYGSYFPKDEKGWDYAKNNGLLLAIEDPEDSENDVAKSSFNIMALRTTFERIFRILSSPQQKVPLLDKIFNVDPELLNYRITVQELYGNNEDIIPKKQDVIEKIENTSKNQKRYNDSPKKNTSKNKNKNKKQKRSSNNGRNSPKGGNTVNKNWRRQSDRGHYGDYNGSNTGKRRWRSDYGSKPPKKKPRYS